MCQQHPQFLTAYRLHMHRTIKPRPHHLRYAARIVAVRLIDLRLQHRLHVPRLNADHRQSCFGESAEQPLRQRSSFQPNSLEVVAEVLQHRQQRFRFARHLYFPNDLACVIHNADARLLDRNVQSSKMVHAALLLLMLEAVFTTSCRPITPSFGWKGEDGSIGRWPYEKLPASVPAPPQTSPSSPDCRDRSHPHWSTGCSPTKSHVRFIRAGSCRGCERACPPHWHKGKGRGRPWDWLHRLRSNPEEVPAAASRPRLASTLATLACARRSPRRTM